MLNLLNPILSPAEIEGQVMWLVRAWQIETRLRHTAPPTVVRLRPVSQAHTLAIDVTTTIVLQMHDSRANDGMIDAVMGAKRHSTSTTRLR